MTSSTEPIQPLMQLAEILSDLVSLRACPPSAAIALVSAHRSPNDDSMGNQAGSNDKDKDKDESEEDDVDLKRAKDLVKLHYEVKKAQEKGELSRGLEEARQSVERAVGG